MSERLHTALCNELKRQLLSPGAVVARIPAGGDLLWRWFLDLSRSRSYHMAGPNPISYSEVLAYAKLMRWLIEPRHVVILLALDDIYLQHFQQKRKQATSAGVAAPQHSSHAVSPKIFDIMFG
jgi:hypothetical protein